MTLVMWNLVLVHLETVLLSMQDRCSVSRQTYHRLRKSSWTHPIVLLGDEAQVDARFDPFGENANLDAR